MTIPIAADVWRRYQVDNVPGSGINQPDKTEIRKWGTFLESLLNGSSAGLAYLNLSSLNADLLHAANTSAIVYGDAAAANNGLYVKGGASGAGSWSRVGDLPNGIVRLTVTGGTANAIVASAPETPLVPGNKLYLLTPTAANLAGGVTVSVNAGALSGALKDAFGNDPAAGALQNASQVLVAWSVDHFQLLISANVDASGILSSALAAATSASASATAAASSASALGNQVAQYDTRAAAIAATIPGGVNFVRTLAYDSSFTENSGAQFKRVATGTPFLDTWPLTGTIAGGSSYTNGTYYGVPIGGSATGNGMVATVTVAGGAVTAVDHSTQPGNAFKVGDVLTQVNAFLGGTGSGFTYTVATISSPLASFTNTAGSTLWQYLPSKGFTHVNEFGARGDYISTDAGATNNFPAIQAALFFASRNLTGTNEDAGGYAGDVVKVGVGSYMLQHPSNLVSLIIPNGIYLEGCFGSTLKFHDGWYAATNNVCLGNPNGHFANFNAGLRDIRLFFKRGIAAAIGTFMVYSNNTQDGGGMENVYIYSGQRGGFKYEIGYGGASTVHFHKIQISAEGPNAAVAMNVGTTIVDCKLWSVNAPSSGTNLTVDAITLSGTGGMYRFDGIHMEGFPNGFNINLTTGNNPQATFKNIDGGFNLAYVFTLQSLNVPGNCSFEQCQMNNGAATGLVLNGQPSGTSRLTDIRPKDGIVSFYPA